MRRLSLLLLLASLIAALLAVAKHSVVRASAPTTPQFTSDGKLVRPVDYRRWVYVSTGFAMNYSPQPGGPLLFTNVFVNPSSYDYYQANGKWPDKTIFVLEEYGSSSKGSINKRGSYQSAFVGLAAEVKDEARFPDKWAYFNFEGDAKSVGAITPSKNDCWKCHDENAAVEHSFVQFYPELLKVARAKNTIKPTVHLE